MSGITDMHDRPARAIGTGDRIRIGYRFFRVNGTRRVGAHQALTLLPIVEGTTQPRAETRLFNLDETVFRINRRAGMFCIELIALGSLGAVSADRGSDDVSPLPLWDHGYERCTPYPRRHAPSDASWIALDLDRRR